MAKNQRKQCTVKGCRKLRSAGTDFCAVHQEDPVEAVKQLTEIERLRFFESDVAMRNHSQEIMILQQEQRLDELDYEARRRVRSQRANELQGAIQQRQIEQRSMLETLSKKYDFDPKFVSIDDQTGTIQEHKPD